MNEELKKIKKEHTDVVTKLDKYCLDGITDDQQIEFNELCAREFELKLQEALINMTEIGSIELPTTISRKIKVINITEDTHSHDNTSEIDALRKKIDVLQTQVDNLSK